MTVAALPGIAELRAHLPATGVVTYLNTGSFGPLPIAAANAMAHVAGTALALGRVDLDVFAVQAERVAALRRLLAPVVGVSEAEIAATHSTGAGVNIVINGLDWRPGDRIVTTSLEHGGVLVPLYQARRRYGVELTFADVGAGSPDQALDALAAALAQPRVRLLALSHVTYGTGARLPLAEITRRAHDAGCLVLADGAQSVGAIPLDVTASGVDFYAFPGQKWLCGPEGTGGLVVRASALDALAPPELSLHSVDYLAYRPNDPASMEFYPSAARFEGATLHQPAVAGLSAAVEWLSEIGLPAMYDTISARAHYALARVAELPGVTLLTPPTAHAGLVSFVLDGVDPAACVAYLASHRVAIRFVPDNGALRLSCGFFTTEAEIDRALTLIDTFRRQ